MNAVTLNKDGSIYQNGRTVKSDALDILSYQIALEEGYTLRSYFEMLQKHTLFAKLNELFPTHTAHYRGCPEQGCDIGFLDYLEFGKTVEMIGVPDKRLEIYNSLSGVQGGEASEIRSMQLESLLDIPLKLGKLKHIVFGDRVDIFEFETVYTLFEFIDGIAWELGFHVRSPLWRRGYATEAARAVIAFAFGDFGANALFAGHHPENATSRRLLERLGFRHTHDELYPPTGLPHPSYLRERDQSEYTTSARSTPRDDPPSP